MSIDFNFGEHYHYGSSNFFLQVFISFLGAFFGFLFALIVNRLFDLKKKNREIQNRRRFLYNQLNYLSFFLNPVIIDTKKQVDKIKEHAQAVKKFPFEILSPEWLATKDLERLTNLSSGDLYESFLYFFPNNEEEFKNYKNIFSNADYLLRIFNDFEKMNDKHQQFIHNQHLIIGDCFENILLKIAKYENRLIQTSPSTYQHSQEYKYLQPFKTIYIEVFVKEFDCKRIKDEFFTPIQSTIFDSVKDAEFLEEVVPFIRKGNNVLRNLEFNSLKYADLFVEDNETVIKAIDFLAKMNEKIKHALTSRQPSNAGGFRK